jgi:transcriptional regulator
MRGHPLGLLITAGPGGLVANPVPFLVYADASKHGTLRAHVARGNPHWQELAAVEQCLVVFQGPQAYISPSWYPTKRETGKVAPTWNYVTVHAWGRPRVIDDAAWLRRQLDDLTLLKEGTLPAPWKVGDAPASFVMSQMKGIIGVEIPIDRIEGKWKVSQNRPKADRAGVIEGLRGGGDAADEIARLVAERDDAAH